MKEFTIGANDAGQRLDKFLSIIYPDTSRSFFQKLIKDNGVLVNQKSEKASYRMCYEDVVTIHFPDAVETTIEPEDIPLDILYEDENLLIINKPAGELSQKAEAKDVSMNEYALGYLQRTGAITEESLKVFKPSVCNRLDRNTSGILIVAKTYQAAREFGEALQKRTVRKFYNCIVKGVVKQAEKIDGYLLKDEKTNKVQIFKDAKEGAAEIHTAYEPLKTKNNLTLLEVHLITGRTHQIRAHLSSIGHSILGDPKYGDKKLSDKYKVKYQLLHACRLELDEFEGDFAKYNGMTITAQPPKIFEKIMTED